MAEAAGDLEVRMESARQRFFEAETIEAHLAVRDECWELAKLAEAAGESDVAAVAWLTTAECCWFVSAASGLGAEASHHLRLVALTVAALAARAFTDGADLHDLETCATLSRDLLLIVSRWPDIAEEGSQVQVAVVTLVAELGRSIPADHVFPEARGGAGGGTRLAGAMVAAWTATGVPVPDWLSDRLLASIDAPRRDARSRLGRLVAASDAEEVAVDRLAGLLETPRPKTPDPTDVFDLIEAISARTLLDGVAGLLTTTDDPVNRGLEREATAYAPPKERSVVVQQISLVSTLPLGGTPEERQRRLRIVDELESRCAELGCGFEGVADTAPLEAVQAVLEPRQVLLRYVVLRHRLHPNRLPHVLVVTSDDARLVRLPVSESHGLPGFMAIDGQSPWESSPLGDAVVAARSQLENGGDAAALTERLQYLYAILVQPVRATGLTDGRDDWIIVPSGALHHVPWMALQNRSGRWLVDDAAVTVAPSASVWMHLLGRGPRGVGSLLALGDPFTMPTGRLPRLPGSATEVQHAEKLWRAKGLLVAAETGAKASVTTLAACAAGAGVVHLATHGSFPDESALFDQGFQLSSSLARPGRVTADDLRRLPLGHTWCAILSLCNGGAYRVGPGSEPYGLVPALLEAGATTVVAPQWAVDDAVSAGLMQDVSDRLLDVGPAQALRKAVLAQRGSHAMVPGDYCAFVAVGTGQGPAPTGP